MKLKWDKTESKYFNEPIKTAERVTGWFWYLVMAVSISTIVWMWVKLYQIYKIHLWLNSIE